MSALGSPLLNRDYRFQVSLYRILEVVLDVRKFFRTTRSSSLIQLYLVLKGRPVEKRGYVNASVI